MCVLVVAVLAVVLTVGLTGVVVADGDGDRGHGNECDGHDEDNPHDEEAADDSGVDDDSPNHDGVGVWGR